MFVSHLRTYNNGMKAAFSTRKKADGTRPDDNRYNNDKQVPMSRITTGQNGTAINYNNPPSSCQRIALYSHETMGLGHLRRNLLIAETLSRAPSQPTILLITGAREASA